MVSYKTVAGPHTDEGNSSAQLMYLVILALLPATLFGIYQFGLSAAMILLVSCATAFIAEQVMLLLRKGGVRNVLDGSALLTGWILAMSLPPATPWWIVALGAIFAMTLGKHAYGGLGNNLFNPAMLARVFLLICFPVEMTDWAMTSTPELIEGQLQFSDAWLGEGTIDAITAATPLSGHVNPNEVLPMWQLFLGKHAGSWGETSALLLLLGGLFLIWKKVITWVLPSAVILGVFIPAACLHLYDPALYLSSSVHVLSGATLFTAFFIATDMVTSPVSAKGQWIFGLGCGLLICLIRSFGIYPEGAAFSVLIMNATTPLIDHYLRPAIFGSKAAKA
ncbi:MAG: RnfABCDGE type electron transport complex subunit D [Colwellia sp.]